MNRGRTGPEMEALWRSFADAVRSLGGTATGYEVAAFMGKSSSHTNSLLLGACNRGLLTRSWRNGTYVYETINRPSPRGAALPVEDR